MKRNIGGGSKFVGALARRACLVQHRGMTKQCFEFFRYVSSTVSELVAIYWWLGGARWCGIVVVSKPREGA